ncbi:MAG: hypothetical protein LBH13_06560 [Cellulomonadaceae bacterium]|jgi:hypothetical protein|nr:hypothetical protein [Cellulomonadaceae bacterium]
MSRLSFDEAWQIVRTHAPADMVIPVKGYEIKAGYYLMIGIPNRNQGDVVDFRVNIETRELITCYSIDDLPPGCKPADDGNGIVRSFNMPEPG